MKLKLGNANDDRIKRISIVKTTAIRRSTRPNTLIKMCNELPPLLDYVIYSQETFTFRKYFLLLDAKIVSINVYFLTMTKPSGAQNSQPSSSTFFSFRRFRIKYFTRETNTLITPPLKKG